MSPRAVVISVGSEILLGELLDTNAAWLSRALVSLGVEPVAHQTVSDSPAPLTDALRRAMEVADLVVTTGGLGPTADDTTRRAAAEATGRPLEIRPELIEPIRLRLASRGREMGENNRRQAYVPRGSVVLSNPVGTAPGFVVEGDSGCALVCLPGVPFEMEEVWRLGVEPFLRRRFSPRGALAVRVLRCVGVGESELDRMLGEVAAGTATATVAFQLVGGEIHLRLVGQGSTEEAAWEGLVPLEAAVRGRLGRLIYGHDGDTLAGVVVRHLRDLGEWLAVVEGATAGALVSALAAADPEGAVFVGGQVAPEASLWGRLGPEGAEEPPEEAAARALGLARWAARRAGAQVGVASTGVVKPSGAEWAATYWLAAVWGDRARTIVFSTSGPPELIHRRAALRALDGVRRLVLGWPETGP